MSGSCPLDNDALEVRPVLGSLVNRQRHGRIVEIDPLAVIAALALIYTEERFMPKFGTHIIIAELAAQKKPHVFNAPHSNAFRLGAVGPDTALFIFDPATSNPGLRKGF